MKQDFDGIISNDFMDQISLKFLQNVSYPRVIYTPKHVRPRF